MSHAHHHAHAGSGATSLRWAAVVSLLLAVTKLVLGLVAGSLAVLASAADSFADAVMSSLNAWGYGWARQPADDEHPFGHGKLEGVLSVGQGMLLLGILASLVVGSLQGLVEGRPAPRVGLAVATLLGGMLVSGALTLMLTRAARGERSLILEADAAHYRMDFLANVLAILGLLVIGRTGWVWLDPLLALGLAAFMAPECLHLLRDGGRELLDEALPAEEIARVKKILGDLELDYHGLRTRRSGPLRFVEVHLVLDPTQPLGEAHGLVQAVGDEIRAALEPVRVLVHPDARGMADATDRLLEEGPAPDREDRVHEHDAR